MSRGRDGAGVEIMSYAPYEPVTIEIKRSKGQPTKPRHAARCGDFESSFYVRAGGTEFEIMASDWKTQKLIKQYGRDILGLTDENITRLIGTTYARDWSRK